MGASDPSDDVDSFLPLPTAVFHILVALADQERHGYAIMQDVGERDRRQGAPQRRHALQRRAADAGAGADRGAAREPGSGERRRAAPLLPAITRSAAPSRSPKRAASPTC